MGYEGIIITDAMNMGAIAENYDSAQAARYVFSGRSGYDPDAHQRIFRTAYQGILQAVSSGTISEERLNQSVVRILETKSRKNFKKNP